MQMMELPVSYNQRYLATSTGTVLVWPFLNGDKGEGPYELFLDTNSLSKSKWFGELPGDMRSRCVINP